MIIEEDVYLEHYGTQGMQWGVVGGAHRKRVAKKGKARVKRHLGKGRTRAHKKIIKGKKAVMAMIQSAPTVPVPPHP